MTKFQEYLKNYNELTAESIEKIFDLSKGFGFSVEYKNNKLNTELDEKLYNEFKNKPALHGFYTNTNSEPNINHYISIFYNETDTEYWAEIASELEWGQPVNNHWYCSLDYSELLHTIYNDLTD